MTNDIALCMIVKNEPADRLAMLCDYVRPVVSKIVIADTGSDTDETELYKSWGVDSFSIPWTDDFASARNSTLARLDDSIGWVLHLDADELPSWTMMQHIMWIKDNAPEKILGYQFFTRNYWGGELGPEMGYHWHCRLFRKGRGRWYKKVHEQVEFNERPDSKRYIAEQAAHAKKILVHADKAAYLIHSKPAEQMEKANELYAKLGEVSR